RMTVTFGRAAESQAYRVHVPELPRGCAIYTAAHTAALESARTRGGEVVAKQNESHKWSVQSEICNPNTLVRANAGKSLREPPGVSGCPAGMAPIPGRSACVDRWEA